MVPSDGMITAVLEEGNRPVVVAFHNNHLAMPAIHFIFSPKASTMVGFITALVVVRKTHQDARLVLEATRKRGCFDYCVFGFFVFCCSVKLLISN